MIDFEHELRLLWAIAMNAALAVGAFRAARALGAGDRVQVWLDAMLLWWAGQYVIVGGLGICGLLSPIWIAVVTLLIAAIALRVFSKPHAIEPMTKAERFAVHIGLSIVGCTVAALVWNFRVLPPMSDDPLTYHLPAAAVWLQNHRITVYETWFFNPANTYSPLGGSIFATWLIAPFGSDVAARFMQAPAVVAIYLAGVQLARRLGASMLVATLLGIAGAVCGPIVRQAALAKDDLFLAAFVLMFINAIARIDKLAPWRIGIAFGLAASMKLTCVYALAPALFLMIIPRKRTPMPRLIIAVACAAVLAGPWYLRNWMQFGNPVFPLTIRLFEKTLLDDLFVTVPSPRLSDPAGLREIFVDGYFSLGPVLAVVLPILLLGAALMARGRLIREAVPRALVIGPLAGTIAFILTSPYGELRFLYPWIITAMLSAALWPPRAMLPLAVAIAGAAVGTSFAQDWVAELLLATVAGVVAVQLIRLLTRRPGRVRSVTVIVSAVLAAATIWVNWRAYVESLPASADVAWQAKYGGLAEAWTFLRAQPSSDQPIAYSGTYLTYPLMGHRLDRRAMHVPVSASVTDLSKLPRFSMPMSERNMLREAIPAMQIDPDRDLWLKRLAESKAMFLLIGLEPLASSPPPLEWEWARSDARFRQVFQNGSAVVYAISLNGDSPASRPVPP